MTTLMMPDITNFFGNVHGGNVLKLLDQATFRQPIHVGELLTFLALVNFISNISIEAGIKVIPEDILTQETRHVNNYFLTMVAMNESRKPVHVPTFIPSTTDKVERHKAAEFRREMRRQLEEKLA